MTIGELITHRIDIVTFRLEQRLKSEHVTIRQEAQQHAALARIYRSLRDTPQERYDAVQRAFYAWFMAILPSYQNNPRIFEAENTRIRLEALAERDRMISEARQAA